MIKNILKKMANFYVIVGVLAFVWMLFFDRYNVLDRLETQLRIHELRADLAFFKAERDRIEVTRDMMESDINELERFARERFMMKKDNEDLFLVGTEK